MITPVRRLMFLVGAYYFLQGMGGNPGVYVQSLQRFLKEAWNFSPTQSAAFLALPVIPWMVKPVYGLVSDFFPIFGLRRKSYFMLVGSVAAASLIAPSWLILTPTSLSLLLFIGSVCFAFSDVLCDALMVEKGQPLDATDRLQAAQWGAISVAGILVAFSKGYIAAYFSLPQAFLIAMPFPVIMVALTAASLEEPKAASSGEMASLAWSGLKRAARLKPLWAYAIFLLLYNCSPNLGNVLYYYEKDGLEFSDVLIGQVDAAGQAGFLLGTLLFGLGSGRLSHEAMLRLIIVSGVASNLLYIFFVDAASAFAVTAIAQTISAGFFLGTLTIAAKICPKYAEGTVFAVLMSVANAGTQIGSIAGSALYERVGYAALVVISTAFSACMWFCLPLARQRNDA